MSLVERNTRRKRDNKKNFKNDMCTSMWKGQRYVYVHMERAGLVDLSFRDTAILMKNGEKKTKNEVFIQGDQKVLLTKILKFY